ncbi:hypothetical protein E0J20_09155 [Rhizobium leguminosarum bv. viciae]|nr:hypothetical protein E0J20_09155 [Rhizobium leguminosarum bv. viciae]
MTDSLTNINGMTPRQVAEMLKLAKIREGGMEPFWADMAASVAKYVAFIALALESDDEVRNRFIESEGCSPYSLAGIYKLAADETMATKAISVIRDLANMNDAEGEPLKEKMLMAAVKAGSWLVAEYQSVRSEELKLRWKGCVEILLSAGATEDELTAQEVQALTKSAA